MKSTMRATALAGLCFSFLLCVTGASFGQNTNSGDIRGTVTDSTGAVLPGATVTVKNVTKNTVSTYTTNAAGLYDTGPILPDTYTLTFTKPGFSSYIRGPITLQVGIVTVNGTLNVGAITQKVVVNTNVPLLQTETGSQSTTLAYKTMSQLPQVGADWQNFVMLMPGTSGTPQNASNALLNTGNGQVASVNGNLPYSTVLANGATTTLPMSQNSDVTVFETTQEVQVSTSAFSAQFGVGGVIYNQITKGGGEQFHGAAYEYFQNDALNAAPYAFGVRAKVPVLRYNNYGVAIGGPIIKHRMFFYFDYDKTDHKGGAANGFVTVPTAAMKAGDFTGFPTIYDPTTQTIDANGAVHRVSFATEYGNGNKIPASLLDPVAKNIQGFYPTANTAGTVRNGLTTNNFFYNTPSSSPFTKYTGRLDFDITHSNRLTLSEISSDNPGDALNQGICPINCQHQDVSRDNAQVSDVWTISPNVVNEARFGFTDQLNFFSPYSLGLGYPQKLGLKFSKADTFPTVNINQMYTLGPQSNAVYKEFVFDPSDVVMMVRGRHVLHFGGEFLINRADSTAWGNLNAATVGYNGSYTAATLGQTGVPYADFLLGQTHSWSASVTPEYGGRIKLPQAFIQDDFKVRPNFTLNIGVRWQGITGWSEVKGNMAAFDPTVVNPVNNTLGAMWYGTTRANGRTKLQEPVWDTIMPRFGFSWQIMPNTVLRGGGGIYAYTWSEDTYGGGMGGALGSSGDSSDTTNGACPVVQLSSDGNSPDTTNPGCGVGANNPNSINSLYLTAPTEPQARNHQNVTYNQFHTPVPKIWQYNMEVQQALGGNMALNLAYVGSHGYDLNFPTDLNQVPEDKLAPNDQASRPYPLFQSISGSTNNAISNYNSLQVTLQRRMAQGVLFNVNYTWAHFLNTQDSSGWGSREGNQYYQNAYRPGLNYAPSNFDVRNAFKGSAIFELPVGRGRRFLSHNALLDPIVGGWQGALTTIIQSGNPYTVYEQNDAPSFSLAGNGFHWFPNVVGNPNEGAGTTQEWFNPAAFATPAPGTFGNSRRNSLTGPGVAILNFSLGKNFTIWHETQFQIRADAQNVLNHPSFAQPNSALGSGQEGVIHGVTVGGRTLQLYGRFSF